MAHRWAKRWLGCAARRRRGGSAPAWLSTAAWGCTAAAWTPAPPMGSGPGLGACPRRTSDISSTVSRSIGCKRPMLGLLHCRLVPGANQAQASPLTRLSDGLAHGRACSVIRGGEKCAGTAHSLASGWVSLHTDLTRLQKHPHHHHQFQSTTQTWLDSWRAQSCPGSAALLLGGRQAHQVHSVGRACVWRRPCPRGGP